MILLQKKINPNSHIDRFINIFKPSLFLFLSLSRCQDLRVCMFVHQRLLCDTLINTAQIYQISLSTSLISDRSLSKCESCRSQINHQIHTLTPPRRARANPSTPLSCFQIPLLVILMSDRSLPIQAHCNVNLSLSLFLALSRCQDPRVCMFEHQ